jgi:hypothetical protein
VSNIDRGLGTVNDVAHLRLSDKFEQLLPLGRGPYSQRQLLPVARALSSMIALLTICYLRERVAGGEGGRNNHIVSRPQGWPEGRL